MFHPKPQFRARLTFTFADHEATRRRVFGFDESGCRRVPMSIDGVDGLHTVELRIGRAGDYRQGDELDVDCRVIWPEGLREAVRLGVRFRLWDSGFFADGIVIETFEDEWKLAPSRHS